MIEGMRNLAKNKILMEFEPTENPKLLKSSIGNVEDISLGLETHSLLIKTLKKKEVTVLSEVQVYTFGSPKTKFKQLYHVECLTENSLKVPYNLKLSDSAIPVLPRLTQSLPLKGENLSFLLHENVHELYFHPCLHQSNVSYLNQLATEHKLRLESSAKTAHFLPLHMAQLPASVLAINRFMN
jgi:hypothetical protein